MKTNDYEVRVTTTRKTGHGGNKGHRGTVSSKLPLFVIPDSLNITSFEAIDALVERMFHFPFVKVSGTVTNSAGDVYDLKQHKVIRIY